MSHVDISSQEIFMSQSKRKFAVEFKTRIALDALSGKYICPNSLTGTACIPISFPRSGSHEQNALKNM